MPEELCRYDHNPLKCNLALFRIVTACTRPLGLRSMRSRQHTTTIEGNELGGLFGGLSFGGDSAGPG